MHRRPRIMRWRLWGEGRQPVSPSTSTGRRCRCRTQTKLHAHARSRAPARPQLPRWMRSRPLRMRWHPRSMPVPLSSPSSALRVACSSQTQSQRRALARRYATVRRQAAAGFQSKAQRCLSATQRASLVQSECEAVLTATERVKESIMLLEPFPVSCTPKLESTEIPQSRLWGVERCGTVHSNALRNREMLSV